MVNLAAQKSVNAHLVLGCKKGFIYSYLQSVSDLRACGVVVFSCFGGFF